MKVVKYKGCRIEVQEHNKYWYWSDIFGVILKSKCETLEVGMEKRKVFRVKIIKCSLDAAWYSCLVDCEFNVHEYGATQTYKLVEQSLYIQKEDCKIIVPQKPASTDLREVKNCGNCGSRRINCARNSLAVTSCDKWELINKREESKPDQESLCVACSGCDVSGACLISPGDETEDHKCHKENKPDQERWFAIMEVPSSGYQAELTMMEGGISKGWVPVPLKHVFPASRLYADLGGPIRCAEHRYMEINNSFSIVIKPEKKKETQQEWLDRKPKKVDYESEIAFNHDILAWARSMPEEG